MVDKVEDALDKGANDGADERYGLSYPCTAPSQGERLEIAPGVHWVRMPLPFALDQVNTWLIDDGDGRALVDTGIRSEDSAAILGALFVGNDAVRPPTRVFATHMHPDHVGMAGWLACRFGMRLWMTRLEYLYGRVMFSDTGREAPPEALGFYHQAGWTQAALESYRARFGHFGMLMHPLPNGFRRLHDGEDIRIGSHIWQVVVGRGHSPEHACFYCPDLKLLISGDQILPRISSNISVHPTEPDADPMAEWLASLADIRCRVADDVLVLPSHNECFRGLHARISSLEQGQNRALERLRQSLTEPKRVVDVFGVLFSRPLTEADTLHFRLATGESLACLNYLLHRGEIVREWDDYGVAWYQLRGSGTPVSTQALRSRP